MDTTSVVKGIDAIGLTMSRTPWLAMGVLYLAMVGVIELGLLSTRETSFNPPRAALLAGCVFAGLAFGAYPLRTRAAWEMGVALFFAALLGAIGAELAQLPLMLALALYDRWLIPKIEHVLEWTGAAVFVLAWLFLISRRGVEKAAA